MTPRKLGIKCTPGTELRSDHRDIIARGVHEVDNGTGGNHRAGLAFPAIQREMAMRTRRMHEIGGQATWVAVLETGDEAMDCLKRFAAEAGLDSASFKAIGAFQRATLAFFDWERKTYEPIPVEEQVEVASLTGDIALGPDGKPAVHVHAVLGRRDGSALAGHLLEGVVRPTLELVLTETPGALSKQVDEESGVALIRM